MTQHPARYQGFIVIRKTFQANPHITILENRATNIRSNKEIFLASYLISLDQPLSIDQGVSKDQEVSLTPVTKVTKLIVVFWDLLGVIKR